MTVAVAERLPATVADPAEVAIRFLDALARRDYGSLEACLAPGVWFRALLPKKIHESFTAPEAVAKLAFWFAPDEEGELVEREWHSVGGRVQLRYRWRIRPGFAPDQWHVVEQAGFCRVKDGHISRLDLVCSGYFPD